jgi:hypothetical protein
MRTLDMIQGVGCQQLLKIQTVSKFHELMSRDHSVTLKLMPINWETIYQILHDDFGKRKISTRFVPYRLTNKQKHHRVTTCEEHPNLTDQSIFF